METVFKNFLLKFHLILLISLLRGTSASVLETFYFIGNLKFVQMIILPKTNVNLFALRGFDMNSQAFHFAHNKKTLVAVDTFSNFSEFFSQ